MTDHPSSGNRWEPAAGETARPVTTHASAGPPAGATATLPPEPPAYADEAVGAPAGPTRWQDRVRGRFAAGRLRIAAAALIVFLGGGAAGYGVAQLGDPGPGPGPGPGGTVPGQAPFGDRHGDGDGDRGPGFGSRQDGPGDRAPQQDSRGPGTADSSGTTATPGSDT